MQKPRDEQIRPSGTIQKIESIENSAAAERWENDWVIYHEIASDCYHLFIYYSSQTEHEAGIISPTFNRFLDN